jgi:hypothetical protein
MIGVMDQNSSIASLVVCQVLERQVVYAIDVYGTGSQAGFNGI